MGREGEPPAPAHPLEVRLVVHGEMTDVGVERDQVVGFRDRLDPVGHQEGVEPVDPAMQVREIGGLQIHRLDEGVDLVALGQGALGGIPGLAHEQRLRALADRRAHHVHDVVEDLILGLEDDDEREAGAFRHLIKEGEGLLAQGALGGVVAGVRRAPQTLDGDAGMRDPIEPPHPRFRIRMRGAQDQAVREVGPEGQILIPGIGHSLEELIGIAAHRGPRVEPGQEPLVEHPAIAAAHPDAGTRERGREPHAHITELGQRQGAAVAGAAVDHGAHPAAAAAPDPARDPILEEPARRPHAIEVRFQRLEVMAGEGGRERAGSVSARRPATTAFRLGSSCTKSWSTQGHGSSSGTASVTRSCRRPQSPARYSGLWPSVAAGWSSKKAPTLLPSASATAWCSGRYSAQGRRSVKDAGAS